MNSVFFQIEEAFSLHKAFSAALEVVLSVNKQKAVFPNCKCIIQILFPSWQHTKIPHL